MTDTASTTWSPKSGNGEWAGNTPSTLVDSSGVQLVDSSGVSLADGDSTFTNEPTTTWSSSDGS